MQPFFEAVEKEKLDIVKSLLAAQTQSPELSVKQNINYQDQDNGMTALHLAAMAETDELVNLLLANGAEPKKTNHDGATPAHIAAKWGNLAAFKSLIENNLDLLSIPDEEGSLPLHLASYHGHDDIVNYIKTKVSDTNQLDNRGQNALYLAALNAQYNCFQSLVTPDNIFSRNYEGESLLFAASCNKDNHSQSRKKIIEILLDNFVAICGDVRSDGIENVDFTKKIILGLKISSTPIEECVEFYANNFCQNATLVNSIYTKEKLTSAIESGAINKDKLQNMQRACELQITAINHIPDYLNNESHVVTIDHLEEIARFLELCITQPSNVREHAKHLIWRSAQTPSASPTSQSTPTAITSLQTSPNKSP